METIYKSKTLHIQSDNVGATYINGKLERQDKDIEEIILNDLLEQDTYTIDKTLRENLINDNDTYIGMIIMEHVKDTYKNKEVNHNLKELKELFDLDLSSLKDLNIKEPLKSNDKSLSIFILVNNNITYYEYIKNV